MNRIKHNTVTGCILLFILAVFVTPYLSSCGKNAGQASSAGLNVQLEVLNLSPDVHPVNLYMHFIKQNSFPYSYPGSSGYFYLNSIDTPLQIRSAAATTTNLISINKIPFAPNHKYSLFITGQFSTDTVYAVVTQDDTAKTPSVGFGKVRFINLATPATPLNITANNTNAFVNIGFDSISRYIQMPAGNYIFQVAATAAPGTFFTTSLGTTTIQDGRLYTLYSYGIVGRTDTSAFNAGVIINR